jgi:hypothetical protein
LRFKVKYFHADFYHQEVFMHCNFGKGGRGVGVVVVLFYFKSHTYKYLVNGQRTLTSPKSRTQPIFWGERE